MPEEDISGIEALVKSREINFKEDYVNSMRMDMPVKLENDL